jgi:hypothetical protein
MSELATMTERLDKRSASWGRAQGSAAAASSIDARVVIDCVRVRVKPREQEPRPLRERRPNGPTGPTGPIDARDHRIVVRELRLDIYAALGELEARQLGERVANALGERLVALQRRRVAAFSAGRARGGRVEVRVLRVVLRGAAADRPELSSIGLALAGAVERGVPS